MTGRRSLVPLRNAILAFLQRDEAPKTIREVCAAMPAGERNDQRRVIRALSLLRDEGCVQLYRGRWAVLSITDCSTCNGRGWTAATSGVCETCKGSGWLLHTARGHENAHAH